MNLSSLFSIVNVSIALIFFKTRSDNAGMMNVVPIITAKQTSAFINDSLHIPDRMNIINIQVGNKIG